MLLCGYLCSRQEAFFLLQMGLNGAAEESKPQELLRCTEQCAPVGQKTLALISPVVPFKQDTLRNQRS